MVVSVVMQNSMNRGALQEQQTRSVASKSYKLKRKPFSEDLHTLRLQACEIRHWLEANSSSLEACHLPHFSRGHYFASTASLSLS